MEGRKMEGKLSMRFISFSRRLMQVASGFVSSLVKEWILRKDGKELNSLCLYHQQSSMPLLI